MLAEPLECDLGMLEPFICRSPPMDYTRFIQQLPDLYHDWGRDSIRPKSEQFQAALNQMQGMTTANVMQLLNFAVSCLEPGEVYCEVGCFRGSTLVGALLNQPDRLAYAIDNFSEFDVAGENLEQLTRNLEAFGLADQVVFCNQDFEEFFADLRQLQPSDRIGVYLYDGAHDYRSQLMGLLLAKPFLADRALIIVDDSNWDSVQQANWDFITAHPQCQLLLDLPTPATRYIGSMAQCSFWNGLQVLSWDAQAAHSLNWDSVQQVRKPALIQAIYNLPPVYEQADPKAQAIEWYELGIAHYQQGEAATAREAIVKAIELDAGTAHYPYSLGVVLETLNQPIPAAQAYQQAISLDPTLMDARNNLGNLVMQHGDLEQAEVIYREAIAINSRYIGSYLNLGNGLLMQGKVEEAIELYAAALELEPANADVQNNLLWAQELAQDAVKRHRFAGDSLYQQKRYAKAIPEYSALLHLQQTDLPIYQALADCHEQLQQYDAAIEVCQQGIGHHPDAEDLHVQIVRMLHECGQTEAAIAQAVESGAQLPDNVWLKLQDWLMVPVLYQTSDEIPVYRQRFVQGLQSLTHTPALIDHPGTIDALAHHTNFFVAYQNQNDAELQRQYGQWVHQVMAARYPQWVAPCPMPPVEGRIRVGYVSGCLRDHTIGKLILGWFRHHDRDRVQIHSYHVYDIDDALSQEFRSYSDAFYQIPNDLEAVCQQILADQPHILVFPEIGMQPLITQLAALRLAPVQCTSWVHPVTSGLPTIDYYLSSDLMEPDTAQAHYSEQLVRLPNLAIAFAKPIVPAPSKPRAAFQLRDDAIVYLACQTLCKYLPAQDAVFAAIAQQVPNAQFVFVARPNWAIADRFLQRLQTAFAAVGLDSERHCVMLPPQRQQDYWTLNQRCDVFLDSDGWSGGHTTLEAIACDLPIVTRPAAFMRGRHSYAILTRLGVTETIARTEAEYIDIAVRLGQNAAWRADIVARMQAQHDRLYNDTTCVRGLEAFYEQCVQQKLAASGSANK